MEWQQETKNQTSSNSSSKTVDFLNQNSQKTDKLKRQNILQAVLNNIITKQKSNSSLLSPISYQAQKLQLWQQDSLAENLSEPESTSIVSHSDPNNVLNEKQSVAIVLPTLGTTPSGRLIDQTDLEVAKIYTKQALAFCERQQWSEAITACKSALNICPNFAEAYKVLGNTLQRINQVPEAIGCYAKAILIQPDMAEAYANLGSLYAKQQKWSEALEYYQKSVAINPKCAGVYRSLAKIWEELNEEDRALDCFFQALDLQPNTLTAKQHFKLGNELLAEGKLPKAIACYRYAVSLEPNFRDAYLKLVKTLEDNGQWREAGVYYQEIIRLQETGNTNQVEPRNRRRIAKLLTESPTAPPQQLLLSNGVNIIPNKPALLGAENTPPKEIRESIRLRSRNLPISQTDLLIEQYLKKAVAEPHSSIIQVNLGSLYATRRQWEQAIIHYQKAIALSPNSLTAYRNLAKVYQKTAEPIKAAEVLYRGYSSEPHKVSATEHCKLGKALQHQGKLPEAIVCYRRAIELEPSLTVAYLGMAEASEIQGNYLNAIACYQEIIKYDSSNSEAYFLLGEAFGQLKKWRQVVLCYQQVVKLQPDHWQAHHKLGDAFSKENKWSEAIAAYRQAIWSKPDFSWSYNNLADALLELSDWQRAADNYRRAIELNPDFPWSHYKLGDVLIELQQWDEAFDAYSQAQEIKPDLPDISTKLATAMGKRSGATSDQALGYYLDAIKREPDNLQLYYKALELDSTNPKLYLQLANTLEKQGLPNEAMNFYKIALQMEPDNLEIQQKLAQVKSTS
jgi:O-antigen biosynthesis protein